MSDHRKAPPLKVSIGWIDTNVKKDAVEFARGYALKHMDAPQISWYTVMSFLGGHLWEVQEGGAGESYLPSAANALAKGVEPAWFRVGTRAFSIALRDGRPYCILQPKDASQALFAMPDNEIEPRGRMKDVVLKGRTMMTIGATVFATGFLFLLANGGFWVALQAFSPDARKLDMDNLPYRQWSKVDRVAPTMFVESLRYAGGQWSTSIKPLPVSLKEKTGSNDSAPPMPSQPVSRSAGVPTAPVPMPTPVRASPAAPVTKPVVTGPPTAPFVPRAIIVPPAATMNGQPPVKPITPASPASPSPAPMMPRPIVVPAPPQPMQAPPQASVIPHGGEPHAAIVPAPKPPTPVAALPKNGTQPEVLSQLGITSVVPPRPVSP